MRPSERVPTSEWVKVRTRPVVVLAVREISYGVMKTRAGNMGWSPGDIIIRSVDVGDYPCKASTFNQTYEIIDPQKETEMTSGPHVNVLEMPRYKCHKEVYALKIADVQYEPGGGAMIVPAEAGYAPFRVDAEFMRKHSPQIGGYYVVYEDGYTSFSPAEAFETGYTKAEGSGHGSGNRAASSH